MKTKNRATKKINTDDLTEELSMILSEGPGEGSRFVSSEIRSNKKGEFFLCLDKQVVRQLTMGEAVGLAIRDEELKTWDGGGQVGVRLARAVWRVAGEGLRQVGEDVPSLQDLNNLVGKLF